MHLKEEIDSQRQQHEARVMSIRTEEKQKMDKMANDLDQKWRDALRYKKYIFDLSLSSLSHVCCFGVFFWHLSILPHNPCYLHNKCCSSFYGQYFVQ